MKQKAFFLLFFLIIFGKTYAQKSQKKQSPSGFTKLAKKPKKNLTKTK